MRLWSLHSQKAELFFILRFKLGGLEHQLLKFFRLHLVSFLNQTLEVFLSFNLVDHVEGHKLLLSSAVLVPLLP